jgi:hypothetical protein
MVHAGQYSCVANVIKISILHLENIVNNDRPEITTEARGLFQKLL